MPEKCGKCELEIGQVKALKCNDCNVLFHPTCTRILPGDKVTTRKSWKCDNCKSETSSTSSKIGMELESGHATILEAISAFRQEVSSKLDKVQMNVDELRNQFEMVKKQSNQTSESVEELKKENQILVKKVADLTYEVNDLEQHSRKSNLLISGVPLTKGEDVYAVLGNLAQLINLKFYRSDVSIAHRLPSRRSDSHPPAIIINFVSRTTKAEWLDARRARRSLSARELHPGFEDQTIYFNEHLSTHTRTVFNAARRMLKDKRLAFVWTTDCRVLVKETERGPIRRISCLEDLQRLGDPRKSIGTIAQQSPINDK